MSIIEFQDFSKNNSNIPIQINTKYSALLNSIADIIHKTPKTCELNEITKVTREPLGIPNRIYTMLKADEKIIKNIAPKDNIDYVLGILRSNDTKKFAIWYNENSRIVKSINISDPNILCKIIYDTPFISVEIQNIIEESTFIHHHVVHDNIVIDLFTPTNSSKAPDDIDTINRAIRICKFMTTISKFRGIINLRLIYLDVKKCMPVNSTYFLPQHVNSASTYKREFITMWRKEEWEKILIHELIHYTGLDFVNYENKYMKIDEYIYSTFQIDEGADPFEIYTELLAILIYTIYILLNSRDKFVLDEFEKLYNIQISFSILQTAKIIRYHGGTKYDDIFMLKIKQKTSVLSYYIIRGAIMYNINEALDFFDKSISFNGRVDDFINLVDNSIKKKAFSDSVNQIMYVLDNVEPTLKATMKMQIF